MEMNLVTESLLGVKVGYRRYYANVVILTEIL